MNRFIIFSIFLLAASCASTVDNHQYNHNLIIEETPEIKDPYEISFKIDSTNKKDEYNLTVSMKLNNESYFASPFSNNNFTGLFNISMEENNNIVVSDSLIETPRSVETIHFRENVPVNVVSVNTTYQQQFKVITQEDFKINGLVQFVIEPNCTMEKIKFVVAYENEKIDLFYGS